MPPAKRKPRPSPKTGKEEAAPRGRPRKELDQRQLDELVQLQCTAKEISAVFGMTEDTLNARIHEMHGCNFSEYFRRHRGAGFVALRRAQMASALKGNVSMQQWLGRQWLGQTEHGSPVHPADEGEEALKAAPPQWEVTIKNVPNGVTPQELAALMLQQLDPVKPKQPALDAQTDEPTT